MRALLALSLTLFLLLFGSLLFLQTPFAKEKVRLYLIQQAAEQGVDLHIAKIQGSLPFEWTLIDVRSTFQNDAPPLSCDTLKLRLSIFPLWRKHIECTYFKVTGGKYQNVPFEASAGFRIDLEKQKSIKLTQLLVEGDGFNVHFQGRLNPNLTVEQGHLSFHLAEIGHFTSLPATGSLRGSGVVSKTGAQVECLLQDCTLASIPYQNAKLAFDAKKEADQWVGEAHLSGGPIDLPLESQFAFRFAPSLRRMFVDDFHLFGPQLDIYGKLEIDTKQGCLEGTLLSQCLDFSVLRPFFPQSYLAGRGGGKFVFKSFAAFQEVSCQVEVEELGLYDLYAKTLTLECTLSDLFGHLQGECSLEGHQLVLADAELASLQLKSSIEPTLSPFSFVAEGRWKDPLYVEGKGSWQKRDQGLFLNLDLFEGFVCKKPFSLREPVSLEWDDHHCKMSNLSLDLGTGRLSSRIDLTPNSSLIKIKGDDFPLALLSLPQKHLSLEGTSSFDIDLISWGSRLQGSCNLTLQRAYLFSEGPSQRLISKGSIQVHLSGDRIQVHTDLKAQEGQFLQGFASLPIVYHHYPFKIEIAPDKPLSAELTAEGKVEELFQFINMSPHRIEGWLSAHLLLSKTAQAPHLQGNLQLHDGLYENDYTGTALQEMLISAKAEGQSIQITHLFGKDKDGGTLEGTGSFLCSPKEQFPFTLNTTLTELSLISFDALSGTFNGNLIITGNRRGSTAKGNLQVAEVTFHIPDQLPMAPPELPITFIHFPEKRSRKKLSTSSRLLLDLDLDVPGKAYIEGKGLQSELKGNIHISGTYIDIAAEGKLQLVQGDFLFSGKVFHLSEGEIIFTATPTPSTYISLSGTCDLPDVSVTALLRGPVSSPKLTFQSSPPLSTSSLLAQILFNTDFSEISAVQALQIAQTLFSLSGGSGPDLLERVRKSLGIDRLTLLTSENDPGKISLQIGKYLMRGVLLTLSQGAESRKASVEVELLKGIHLQAEVNEDQQGKFSLKWHHHY